jgi:hypothetical protein
MFARFFKSPTRRCQEFDLREFPRLRMLFRRLDDFLELGLSAKIIVISVWPERRLEGAGLGFAGVGTRESFDFL